METPFLRKMCFGYLYNLHSLNGKEESNEIDWSDGDEPSKTKSQSYYPDKNKRVFKLYNDFSHCPIISKQTWYKKSDVPVPTETLKRQLSHVEDKGTVYGPVEKKRKEEFDLNKEDDGDETQSMEEDPKKDMNAVNAALVERSFEQVNGSHNYSQSNSSQNANGTRSIPNTSYDRGLAGTDEDDDDDSNYNGSDDSSSALEIQGYGEGSFRPDGKGGYEPWSATKHGYTLPFCVEEDAAEESNSETLSEETQHRTTQ
jgi:hypothetical protein